MNKFSILSCLLLICGLAACGNMPDLRNGSTDDREQRIKIYMDSLVSTEVTPGIQYVVVDKERALFQYAAGEARINAEAMSLSTPMMLYSASKLFTAVAVLQLADDNKLQLDHQLSQYLPEIPYKTVTIRQILSHRAGIPDPIIGNMYVHPEHEHRTFDQAGMLKTTLIDNTKLKFEPGSDVKYSNLGYALLGELIAVVSGMSYEAYITENILKPLDMTDGTAFEFSHFDSDSRGYVRRYSMMGFIFGFMLDGFTPVTEGGWKSFKERWYFNFPAHGGLIANAPSASRFVQAMLLDNPGILSPKQKAEFFLLQGKWKSSLLNSTHNALGWFYNENGKAPYYFHEGSAFGYISEFRVYPESGIASVILVNTTNRDHKEVMDSIDGEFMGEK